MIDVNRIENASLITVNVDGPHGATHLYLVSGIAVFRWNYQMEDFWDGWAHENLHISMLQIPGVPRFYQDQVVSHGATAALASFSFTETAKKDTWGFAVDSTQAFFTEDPTHIADFSDFGLDIDLVIRGYKANMFRVSFQMNILVAD